MTVKKLLQPLVRTLASCQSTTSSLWRAKIAAAEKQWSRLAKAFSDTSSKISASVRSAIRACKPRRDIVTDARDWIVDAFTPDIVLSAAAQRWLEEVEAAGYRELVKEWSGGIEPDYRYAVIANCPLYFYHGRFGGLGHKLDKPGAFSPADPPARDCVVDFGGHYRVYHPVATKPRELRRAIKMYIDALAATRWM